MNKFAILISILLCQAAMAENLWPKLPTWPLPGIDQKENSTQTRNTPAGSLFVPSDYDQSKSYSLVVLLHGCLQSALDIAKASQMNQLAEQEKFLVLYPEQNRSANSFRCWNWFDQQNQGRSGEANAVVEAVEKVQSEYNINAAKIYVAGFSAGGGLASVLINCYSDVFAKAAIHSGISYMAARSGSEAFPAMNTGSQTSMADAGRAGYNCGQGAPAKLVSVFSIHGTRDNIVTPKFLQQVQSQILIRNDHVDDGEANSSLELLEEKSENGREKGYSFILSSKFYRGFKLQTLQVNGLKHAWGGGVSGQQYSDPKGPNSSQLIWQFFSQN